MTEPAASRFEIGDEPHFPLHILRSIRVEVDALLSFLLSESKAEIAHNEPQILCPACRVELVGLMEALLREIAATLANVRSGESVDEQDHR